MDENLELVIQRVDELEKKVSRMINILEEITEIFKQQFGLGEKKE